MPFIRFTGTSYTAPKYNLEQPGVYEMDEIKADQVLADFPDQFERVEDTKEAAKSLVAPAVEEDHVQDEMIEEKSDKKEKK
jgi:hypothetical protein